MGVNHAASCFVCNPNVHHCPTQKRLLRDQNTSFSRRIGFVIMATRAMAQLAIQHLDSTVPSGATEPIYVKYADEDGKKRHAPAQQPHNGLPNNSRATFGHQNQHQNSFPNSNNYLSQQQQHQQQQQQGFSNFGNNPNSFMMGMGSSQSQLSQLSLQNLGKMKNSRSNVQNRYNPIGAAAGKTLQLTALN
jgi:RNA recognition motif-containing protein